jgi:hypothetical protein
MYSWLAQKRVHAINDDQASWIRQSVNRTERQGILVLTSSRTSRRRCSSDLLGQVGGFLSSSKNEAVYAMGLFQGLE